MILMLPSSLSLDNQLNMVDPEVWTNTPLETATKMRKTSRRHQQNEAAAEIQNLTQGTKI